MKYLRAPSIVSILLLILMVPACGGAPAVAPTTAPAATAKPTVASEPTPVPTPTVDFETLLEDFDPANFDNPTDIDNPWFPLQPGNQWVYEGVTEESGFTTSHRVIFTVTDLTKEIGGIRTVVVWDQDYSAGELVETELAFFAQDNEGTVWHLGQYPEVYENGVLVEAPAWVHSLQGARAGISMKAAAQSETPSYSQGWGPAVNWTDRAQVAEIGAETCVPVDCYENVLIIEEFSREEPGAFQLKYYAEGVGNVRVGWKGADATKETLELVDFVQLSSEELAAARLSALELEQRAYEISKDVYDQTPPSEPPSEASSNTGSTADVSTDEADVSD